MATLDEMRQANDNIQTQMQEWRQQRYANGENPMDWVAFRQHVLAIGAADPGEQAPDEFHRWDESMHGGQPGGGETVSPSGGQISEVNSLQPGAVDAGSGDTATWPAEAGAGSMTSNWPTEKPAGR